MQSEPNNERLTVFGDEMRKIRDMVLLIQHSLERVETRHMNRTYTCHNATMPGLVETSLSQNVSLQYLDLAPYHRKRINDESTKAAQNNPNVSNLSKSCVILNEIDL